MSSAVDQKAYLQRYLSGPSGEKKKKKKKPVKGKGFKIIDDDLDLSKLRPLDGEELDILNEGEDAPQIAGIIDERPDELKKLDYQMSTKWRVINQDDGFNSKLQVQEVKKDKKEVEKENEIVFGKMYSDSEDEKNNDSDLSPPRKNDQINKQSSSKKSKHNSDSDFSPPRKNRGNDCDLSPPRKNSLQPSKNFKDRSPQRKSSKKSKSEKKNYDPNASPPRKARRQSPGRQNKSKRQNSDSDASPPRRKDESKSQKRDYDSDLSPARKSKNRKQSKSKRSNSDSDVSPPRKKEKSESKKRNYDSDLSPPRKNENKSKERARKPSRWGDYDENYRNSQRKSNQSPEVFKQRRSRSPDRNRQFDKKTNSNNRNKKYDSDASPSTKSRHVTSIQSDSDVSPPRKRKPEKQNSYMKNNSDSDLSPPRRSQKHENRRMEKTLDGKKAGLQDAKQLKEENNAFRRREDEAFRNMTDEMSGRNAQAVSRKGKRETSEDRQKQREKAERQKELDEKYKKWSKGLKQLEAQQAAAEDFIHESSKPLARYKDDRDLESKLKDVERQGDPMLKYIREKKRERGDLGPEKPTYKGNFPPNRFNIRPGYRWDGVDRSNGYEKKFFEQQSKRKAQEEEAYKWSTEDL
ncbi:unnamed protein product, partial [Brenthis ino]